MSTVNASFSRDNNRVPITTDGITSISNIQNLVANNATVAVPLFHIVGSIEVRGLWGIVTTVLGNNTVAYWRLNDQTAQPAITVATGTTLTGALAGSMIMKTTTAGSAIVLENSSAGRVQETSANHQEFQNFSLTKKNGATTDVEFVYTTTDTPTTGAIQFFIRWLPLSTDGNVVVI